MYNSYNNRYYHSRKQMIVNFIHCIQQVTFLKYHHFHQIWNRDNREVVKT
jgi:hypothetical protein